MTVEPLTPITVRELWLLQAAASGLDISEPRGEALFLQVGHTGRRWLVESPAGRLDVEVPDDRPIDGPIDGTGWIAVSERIRRFAHGLERDEVQLSIADGQTLVVSDGEIAVAIDMVAAAPRDPRPPTFRAHATGTVSIQEFTMVLNAARALPLGVVDTGEQPMPTMWMELGGDSLGLHVDWTAFDAARATYRVAATGSGHTTVSIPHVYIERFLRSIPPFDDQDFEVEVQLTMSVGWVVDGSAERAALRLESGEWTLLLWLVHPLEERWGSFVDAAISRDSSLDIIDTDGVEWLVRYRHREARVVLHHGQPDVARVSAVLVTDMEESLDLLRELSQLNASSTGIRYWHQNDAVYAVADVRCGDLASSLADAIRDVATAADAYAPMLQAFTTAAI